MSAASARLNAQLPTPTNECCSDKLPYRVSVGVAHHVRTSYMCVRMSVSVFVALVWPDAGHTV